MFALIQSKYLVVWLMACFALDTLLRVRIHAREILVDLWLWLRVQVMILLSLLGPSAMAWAIVVRKENQQSTQKSPSTWTGLRQTWAKSQTLMYNVHTFML